MSALVVLIAASLILASAFLFAFIRATKKGQYEDVYTPSVRILFDEVSINNKKEDEYEPSVPVPAKEKSQTTKKWN
jgi:cbb3-type cytochrome oxidase maturation protein